MALFAAVTTFSFAKIKFVATGQLHQLDNRLQEMQRTNYAMVSTSKCKIPMLLQLAVGAAKA